MKNKRDRIVLGALLAIVGLFVAWFFRHQPVARMWMADGTELRLEYVTYGTEHRMPGAGRFVAWASRFAQRWPALGIPVYETEYRCTFEQPELVLWFTHFDPKTGKFLAPPTWIQVEAAEGYSAFFKADDSPGSQSAAAPTPTAAFFGSVYERRKPELRLRFGDATLTSLVTLPNPAAKTTFPVWHSEPMPQVRRVGELEVVLRSIKALQTPDGGAPQVAAEIEILHKGLPAGFDWSTADWGGIHFDLSRGWEILDATGNTGRFWYPASFSEPVWKLRAYFSRTGDFPFAETDGRILGPVRMPEAGKCEILPLSEGDRKWGLRFAVLLGAGYYRWEDGVLVESRIPRPEIQWWVTPGEPVKEQTILAYCEAPSVFLVYSNQGEGFGHGTDVGFEQEKVVRVRSGEEGYGLAHDSRFTSGPSGFEIGTNSLQAAFYALTRSDKPELSNANPAKSLPARSEVRIQIVPMKRESIEFFVTPPTL